MEQQDNKNLIWAIVLMAIVLVVWQILFPPELPEETAPEQATVETPANGTSAGTAAPGVAEGVQMDRDAAVADAERITIDTPELRGSINLKGARFDDLAFKEYQTTIEDGAPDVELLNPARSQNPYYAFSGWLPVGGLDASLAPGPNSTWQVADGGTLTPETPVTLEFDNGQGLVFTREISIDDKYMVSINDSVTNEGGSAVTLLPYSSVLRQGEPSDTLGFYLLHEGLIRSSDGVIEEMSYDDLRDLDPVAGENGGASVVDVATDGWIGITDKYWQSVIIPDPGSAFASVAKYETNADNYRADVRQPQVTVDAGGTITNNVSYFLGAKEIETLREYQREQNIDRLVDTIDWGWFWFLTKPIAWALHLLYQFIGNMGVAIIGLTFIIKALTFPLAYKSGVSMTKMKKLQPQMEALKEQAGDDRQKLQQGMMQLYKKEKVNPVAGCLPLFIQIPIFFALYKTLFVSLEIRHKPFIGWIQDLSAPDPSSIYNLFWLLPWDAPESGTIMALIFIGVMPILLGVSMWLMQKLNPTPTDPTQATIFAWMPWVFMFMLGSFASGLVLYYITSNILTFVQQYAIMRSQGVKPDVLGNILKKKKKAES